MKLSAAIMLSVLTIPAYAQSMLEALNTYQKDIQPKVKESDNSQTNVKVEPVIKTKTNGECKEESQRSLPLAYITSLIMEKDGKLDILHDARNGKLSIKSPEMISNCNSMIEWVPNAKVVDGRKIYSIEAKIKEGEECKDGECSYSVAKVENGEFKAFEKIKLKSNMKGFEQCLQASGVIKDGKVVSTAIYPAEISEKFDGYKESGDLLFLSNGPSSKLVKAKYDKFVEIDGCDHYEKISPEGVALLSLEEAETNRIMAEKEQIKDCGEYSKIADFIEKYQGYADDLNSVRDALIIEAVKKAAKAITEGKYTEDDLKTLADFEKYIVQPRVDLSVQLYEQAQELEGSEQKAVLDEMKKIQGELAAFNQPPFISAAIVQKLEADGRFEDAEKANGIKALIVGHARIGATVNSVVLTPEVAKMNTLQMKDAYAAELVGKKEKYEIRTGQTSGQAQYYAHLSSRMRQNIMTRTQNFTQEINSEYARIQPGGHCYRPYRNAQRCIKDSMERIQELQAQLQHFNKVDAERAVEYEAKAKEYGALELEGRRYIAQQNGETLPNETVVQTDNTMPTQRDEGYTFQYQGYDQNNQQQQYQQQYNPNQQQQFQQQYNPYQQQNGFSGQFNAGANFGMNNQYGYNQGMSQYPQTNGYSFNYQGGMGQQQQYNPYQQYQQQGYWGQPYQAYGNYNMYGGYR